MDRKDADIKLNTVDEHKYLKGLFTIFWHCIDQSSFKKKMSRIVASLSKPVENDTQQYVC